VSRIITRKILQGLEIELLNIFAHVEWYIPTSSLPELPLKVVDTEWNQTSNSTDK